MARRLSVQSVNFFKFLLSLNSQRRLGNKANKRPRSHVGILISWTLLITLTWIDCLNLYANKLHVSQRVVKQQNEVQTTFNYSLPPYTHLARDFIKDSRTRCCESALLSGMAVRPVIIYWLAGKYCFHAKPANRLWAKLSCKSNFCIQQRVNRPWWGLF